MEGPTYLQRLIRLCAATPAITAAAVAAVDQFAELVLYLQAPDGLSDGISAWLAPLGETVYAGPDGVVTTEGLVIEVRVNVAPPPGTQVLFERGAQTPPAVEMPDLAAVAARFWRDLYHGGAAIGREELLTAHGRLEACRVALVDLYRLALAPGRPGQGWEGFEGLPGADRLLESTGEWLVAPLELRSQWRCAGRLAEAYEKLMLPLAERLQLDYPWAMRNLAFRRLDEIRPDRATGPEAPVPRLRDLATEAPGRVKVKLRRPK